MVASPADGEHEEIRAFRERAEKLVRQQVQVIVEPKGKLALMGTLRSSVMGSVFGDPVAQRYAGIFYDLKLAGEAQSNPQLRACSYQAARMKKLIQAVVGARPNADGPGLHPGAVYFVQDACKHGRAV